MTSDPKDAERLATVLARQLAGHFAARSVPTWETIHAAARELREVAALHAEIVRITQERDEARRSAETRRSGSRKFGKRDGIRWAITWLHRRAEAMNDPRATAILNSAAFCLGCEIREGRIPAIPDATQPGADDAERAREIVEAFPSYAFDRQHTEVLVKEVAAAFIAARREERQLRALDEAARAVDAAWVEFSEHGNHDARLITKLYARLDDLNAALAARDAGLTDGEGER